MISGPVPNRDTTESMFFMFYNKIDAVSFTEKCSPNSIEEVSNLSVASYIS